MKKNELQKGIKLQTIFMAIAFAVIIIGKLAESLKPSLTQSVGLPVGIVLIVTAVIIGIKNLLTSKKYLANGNEEEKDLALKLKKDSIKMIAVFVVVGILIIVFK
jgi:uncharacterized protein YqhQ